MNSAEFQNVLAEALERRYASIPDPEELSFDYEFSPRFERKMKRMIRRFDHIQGKEQRAERKETNFRFRKGGCICPCFSALNGIGGVRGTLYYYLERRKQRKTRHAGCDI